MRASSFKIYFQVPGFVAALRIFLTYSLTSRKARTIGPVFGLRDKEVTSTSSKANIDEAEKVDRKPYRPPHLREKDSSEFQRSKNFDSKSSSDYESSVVDFPSSDSDYSDSDSSMRDIDSRNSKVRLAAVICIQVRFWRYACHMELQMQLACFLLFAFPFRGLLFSSILYVPYLYLIYIYITAVLYLFCI